MKRLLFFISLAILVLSGGCQRFDDLYDFSDNGNSSKELRIAVISDLHYMAPSLLVNDGMAFQSYIAQDPKWLTASDTLLNTAVLMLMAQKPDIVLIPGDLTKDGEKVSHEAVASLLDRLRTRGIKVFVTPGNHDINNAHALQFDGNNATPVPTITAAEFETLYENFGFNDAVKKDPNSLSYLCQPYKNLWILAIDANKYSDAVVEPITSGAIKPETMAWIKTILADAKTKGITVIGMMHHNLLEHYTGEETIDPGYVLDNWQNISQELMDAGLKLIFTGHYHANDVVKKGDSGSKFLFDAETDALVHYPCTYRMVTVKNNEFSFKNYSVSAFVGEQFNLRGKIFLQSHLTPIFAYLLMNRFYVPAGQAMEGAPLFTDAYMAHFAGDEAITPAEKAQVDAYIAEMTSIDPGFAVLGNILYTFWTDINTPDNTLTINLSSGIVKRN